MGTDSITIKDIAKLLGISKSTVSRALSEHSDVNLETKKKVLEIAQKLNYQPNALALNLKQQRTHTIGVLIPETVNHFFVKAIGGIQRVANLAGYNVMTCQSDESFVTERNNLQSLLVTRVDGILISVATGTETTEHFDAILQRKLPVVFFDRICEGLKTSQVYTNNYDIAFEGTEHLIAQGCKRIAIVAGPQNLSNSRNRLEGYIDALKNNNLPVKENYILHSNFSGGSVEEYTRRLINLPERPDAVFAINDYAAIEMMHVMKKNGLRIPQDIAVLGFNNENICPFVEPSLSSIDHPAFDIGTAAAEILLHQIKTGNLDPQRRIIKSKLVMRESTHLRPVS